MPNWIDDGDFRVPDRARSTRHGAVRKARREDPVFCSFDYQIGDVSLKLWGDPTVPDDEALCAKLAVRHTDPPRCNIHGGVHAADSRKRTEGGYVKVNERMRQLMTGEIDIDSLDDEELVRGQLKNENGRFHGKPQMVPREMHQRMTAKLFERANNAMKDNLVAAVSVLVDIMKSEEQDPKDKMKAAQWLIERVMGKTPENVKITQDSPWQSVLTHVTGAGAEAYAESVRAQAAEAKPDDDRF